jgi:hypothetical protein
MNSEFLKKKRSSFNNEDDKFTFDVILYLYTTILRKEACDKCLCSNIIPEVDNVNTFYEEEIVPNIEVASVNNSKFKLNDFLTYLKICGYPLTGAMLSVYLEDSEAFVLVGGDPLDNNIMFEFNSFPTGIVKIRAICYIEEKHLTPLVNVGKNNSQNLRLTRSNSNLKKSKRTKERKIGYIIEKVNTWRKLYNGFYDEYGKFTKYSLDEAAKIIGISKKSLDDYLLQLRLGRKFGFDFNSNKTEKVGSLRSFVKQNRNLKSE